MTTGQKIIKYCAMAFALFLILNILNGICSAVFCVAGLTGKNNSEYMKKGAKEYVIEEDVNELKIDLSVAELEIKTGDELKVETNHRYIQCRVDDGCLVIQEKRPFLGMNAKGMNVCLTIPESMVWESIDMDAGIGDVTIEDVSLNNADIDIGIGELDLTGELTGECNIDYGIGETNLVLYGSADDYQIELDKGIGEATLDNMKMGDDSIYGSGKNHISVDGGIGELNISFYR